MTLPNATLFPQALLPLYIFEPRYRQMLADALRTHRMFSVAMQRPGDSREMPSPVAGLGLIRVSVGHRDGSSHLILQGLARVELEQTVRYKPYRVQRIRPLQSPPCDRVKAGVLVKVLRGLLQEWIDLGLAFPFPVMSTEDSSPKQGAMPFSSRDILKYLSSLDDAEQAVDLVSCAVLSAATDRQAILETADVETRLRKLIRFLRSEIRRSQKPD